MSKWKTKQKQTELLDEKGEQKETFKFVLNRTGLDRLRQSLTIDSKVLRFMFT